MPSLRRAFLVLSAVSGLFAYTNRASACGALPCAQVLRTLPQSQYVPLNTEIRVLYFGTFEASAEDVTCELDLTRIRLLPSSGEAIELSGTLQYQPDLGQVWVVAKPPALLDPHTDYGLQVQLGGGIEVCSCEERQWTTLATFTTRDGADHVAPDFGGVPTLTYGEREAGANSCGSYDFIPAFPAADFQDAHDQGDWSLAYNTYVDGQLVKRFVQSPSGPPGGSELQIDCGNGALPGTTRLLPGSRLEVRAVDLAGNESAPTPSIEVPDVCTRTPGPVIDGEPDGEAAPLPDSAPAATSAEPIASRTNPSCGLTPGAGHGAGFGAALLFLASLLGRRRPARR